MTKTNTMHALSRVNAFVAAGVIATTALIPALLLSGSASGAQLTSRSINMSSGRDGSDAAGQDVTYSVGFTIPTTGNVGGVVIDFCAGSPIVGDACTGPTGFNTNKATLELDNQTGITDFAIDADESTSNMVVLNRTAASVTGPQAVSFDLGSSGATDGITNPTSNGTFYARITTFTTPELADAYTSTEPGTYVDDGGIALAITNELTLTARVQEVLQFCIGTDSSSAASILTYDASDDCTDISGTNLSLGVVDSSAIQTTTNGDRANDGLMMIRTNAVNGAAMYYKAEQNEGSGRLKVAGATCTDNIALNDQCFNSVGSTRAAIAAGTEKFGMALKERSTATGGATDAVTCAANYQGDGTAGCTGAVTGSNYAWVDDGTFTSIASSIGPIDDEIVAMEFAATASPTTPTGLYTVTANFVATATF